MIVIVGAGVIGLHIGIELRQRGHAGPIFVCDKEDHWAAHSSGRNSEVIHAGYAYIRGSRKERSCLLGRPSTYAWLERLGVAHRKCGKWIVARDAAECEALEKVWAAGRELELSEMRRATAREFAQAEPGCHRFEHVLYVGCSGIMDSAGYIRALAGYFEQGADCHLLRRCEIGAIDAQARRIESHRGPLDYDVLINAAGLWADDVYRHAGGQRAFEIRPFKGEYYTWKSGPVRGLVYPPPRSMLANHARDPRHASNMGVHVHRSVAGAVAVGPTQVESSPAGKANYDFSSPRADFVREARRWAPLAQGQEDALTPAFVGHRAKLFEAGRACADFEIVQEGRAIHLLGIESPGLTAAPALAREVAHMVATG